MIADYPGPPGPLGFAEFFGWWAVCIIVGLGSGRLLASSHEAFVHRALTKTSALALQLVFLFLLWADIQPDTPGAVKGTVEYTLQAIGVVAIAALLTFLGWVALTSRKRRESA